MMSCIVRHHHAVLPSPCLHDASEHVHPTVCLYPSALLVATLMKAADLCQVLISQHVGRMDVLEPTESRRMQPTLSAPFL